MSTPMHFRKRQLLEYQYETSLSLLNERSRQIDYPSSPSSLDSGKSTPVGDVTANCITPFKRIISPPNKFENDFRRVDINRCSYDVDRSDIFSYHNYAKRARTEDESFQPNPFTGYSQTLITDTAAFVSVDTSSPSIGGASNNPQVLKQDAAALVAIANQLKQSIEANLRKQKAEDIPTKPKPSTILLAKLKELKEKSQVQSKNTISVPEPQKTDRKAGLNEKQPITSPNSSFVKRDMKTSTPKMIEHNSDSLFDIIGIYTSMLEEGKGQAIQKKTKISEFNQCNVIKYETSPEFKPLNNQTSEIRQTAKRIAGVFASINKTLQRLENFQKQGINVYEKLDIIDEHTSYNCKRHSSPPLLQRSATEVNQYMDTPTTSKFRQPSTPKGNKPRGRMSSNFVHITADTLPEDLILSPNISINYNDMPSKEVSKAENNNLVKYPMTSAEDENLVVIGPNGTLISKSAWSKIDWSLAAPAITRKILMIIFDRETLATHSLTGRPSPAFKDLNKPEKKPLDTAKVADVVYIVTSRINASSKEIRMAITTKCADECKMAKWREQKLNNKENKGI